jgi:hypothetical protein
MTAQKRAMMHRFQFNRKNGETVEVEGVRVDIKDGHITVVDAHGQPLASFAESELSTWFRNIEVPEQ